MRRLSVRKYLPVLVFAAILFSGCSSKSESTEIVVISTNDMHGAIDGMPALATLVDRYRDQSNYVLLVDAGDKWTGNPYVDLYDPKGAPVIELMNLLKYDLTTVGNHGFDNGLKVLSDRIRSANSITVLANVGKDTTSFPELPPYVFITIGGVKVGFVGALDTSRDGYPDGKPENFGGVVFSDPLETVLKYKHLQDSCDVLIGLTHLGFEADSILATRMPELDLIVGGHSHTVLPEGRVINNVLVTQAGKSLKYAGVTTLRFDRGRLLEKTNTLVALDTVAPQQVMRQEVERFKQNPDLQRVLGSFEREMSKTALINFMTDAILESSVKPDFALSNWNNVRTENHPAGNFTVADLFAMEPFRGTIWIQQMTLGNIRELVLNKFNTPGKEGYTVDISPAGMRYLIQTDDEGKGVEVVFYDPQGWELPYSDKKYRVAISDYVNATYPFSLQGQGEPTGILVTDVLTDYLKKHSPVAGSPKLRVQISPKQK